MRAFVPWLALILVHSLLRGLFFGVFFDVFFGRVVKKCPPAGCAARNACPNDPRLARAAIRSPVTRTVTDVSKIIQDYGRLFGADFDKNLPESRQESCCSRDGILKSLENPYQTPSPRAVRR